jgi:hypothetical protein
MELVLRVFEHHLEELQDGLDMPGRAKMQAWVPLSVLFGSRKVPVAVADVIRRGLRKMVSSGDVSGEAPWMALEFLFADYLAGPGDEPDVTVTIE